MIHEMFTILRASFVTPLRQFKKDRVWNDKDSTSTVLRDAKLEKQIKDYTNYQAFQFLSSIGQILDELGFPKDRGGRGD